MGASYLMSSRAALYGCMRLVTSGDSDIAQLAVLEMSPPMSFKTPNRPGLGAIHDSSSSSGVIIY